VIVVTSLLVFNRINPMTLKILIPVAMIRIAINVIDMIIHRSADIDIKIGARMVNYVANAKRPRRLHHQDEVVKVRWRIVQIFLLCGQGLFAGQKGDV